MAAGSRIELTEDDKDAVAAAVDVAESETGLEILLYIGNGWLDSRKRVAKLLARQGISEQPSVIIGVLGRKSKIEIVTQDAARQRLSDEECAQTIAAMAPGFRQRDWVGGIRTGLEVITAACGKGTSNGPELPNLLD